MVTVFPQLNISGHFGHFDRRRHKSVESPGKPPVREIWVTRIKTPAKWRPISMKHCETVETGLDPLRKYTNSPVTSISSTSQWTVQSVVTQRQRNEFRQSRHSARPVAETEYVKFTQIRINQANFVDTELQHCFKDLAGDTQILTSEFLEY